MADFDHEDDDQRVIVTDIHMSFGSMVSFMVKWALASIPALIILTVVGLVGFFVVTCAVGIAGHP